MLGSCYRCPNPSVVSVREEACLECFDRLIISQFKTGTSTVDWEVDETVVAVNDTESCWVLLDLVMTQRETARTKAALKQWSRVRSDYPDRVKYVAEFRLPRELRVVTVSVAGDSSESLEKDAALRGLKLEVMTVDVDPARWKSLNADSRAQLRRVLVGRQLSTINSTVLLGFTCDALAERAVAEIAIGGGHNVAMESGFAWGPKTWMVPLQGLLQEEIDLYAQHILKRTPRTSLPDRSAPLSVAITSYVGTKLETRAVRAIVRALGRCESTTTTALCRLCERYVEGPWNVPLSSSQKERVDLVGGGLCGSCTFMVARNQETVDLVRLLLK